MKKVLIAVIVALSIGTIKSEGSGAGVRRVRVTYALQESTSPAEHIFVEDGVYVRPSYAIDLFDEIQ